MQTRKIFPKIMAVILSLAMISALLIPAAALTVSASNLIYEAGINVENNDVAFQIERDYTTLNIDASADLSYAYSDADPNYGQWAKDLDLSIEAKYDDTNIYIKVTTDTKHYYNELTEDDAGNMWNQSCIQIGLAGDSDSGDTRLEFGIGRNSTSGEQLSAIWAQSTNGLSEYNPDGNFSVSLAGGYLTYEVAVPFDTFLGTSQDQIGLSVVAVQSDNGNGEIIHTQLAAGTTGDGAKDASLFAIVGLGVEPIKPISDDGINYEEGSNVANNNVKYTVASGSGYTTLPINKSTDLSFAYAGVEGGPYSDAAKNLDFTVEAKYDASSIDLRITVMGEANSPYYHNDFTQADAGGMWAESCIQIGLAPAAGTGTRKAADPSSPDYGLEIGLGRNSTTGEKLYCIWTLGNLVTLNELTDSELDANSTVEMTGNNLVYEVSVPFSVFLNKATITDGDIIGLCVVFSQVGVGETIETSTIHTQLAKGITGVTAKTSARFAQVALGAGTTAPYTPQDTGSSGGGSSTSTASTAADSTATAPAVTVNINGQNVNATVTADGTLAVKYSEADVAKYKDNTGNFDITVSKQEKITLSIPSAALGSDNLVVNTDFGTITIPNEALKELQKLFGDSPITLSIVKGSFNVSLIDSSGRKIAYNDPKNPLTITLPYQLANGQKAESVVAVKKGGSANEIVTYGVYNTKTKGITFNIAQTGIYDVIYNQKDFSDISGHWAEKDVNFMTARGLIDAANEDGDFQPDMVVTRAMFADMFAKLESADLSKYKTSSFTDVTKNAPYLAAVEWAAETGIIKGIGNNLFAPDQPVTREQMATMLDRYIKYKGWTIKSVNDKAAFADTATISDWAAEAVDNIQQAGIIIGKPGNLYDPKGITTKAEYATIFARLIQMYSK
ncbi:MAG: S-layer homology domain-containing protein [Oscillospiraceae bacterium]|nr:S-layer homology domain-containing protein [Oscillospiraceae bacterium]